MIGLLCVLAVSVMWLRLAVLWSGLWSVIVAFPFHTGLLLDYSEVVVCMCVLDKDKT